VTAPLHDAKEIVTTVHTGDDVVGNAASDAAAKAAQALASADLKLPTRDN
jgi:hypothetical protein